MKIDFPYAPWPHTCIDSPLSTLPTKVVCLLQHIDRPTVHSSHYGSVLVYILWVCNRHFQYLFIKHVVSGFALTPFLFLGFRTMCPQYCISFADVEKAHINIRDFIHLTPVLSSSILNKVTGRNLFFKCELFQKTGSFKVTIPFDIVSCYLFKPFSHTHLFDPIFMA